MNKILFNILFFFGMVSIVHYAYAQNGTGIPAVVNYTKFDYHGGSQNWDIGQDKQKVMYFANNDGLLTFDGSHWKLHPLPNKTVIWSLAIGSDGKIYVGGQDEIGYFSSGPNGALTYTSIKDKIPEQHRKFADIWHIAITGNRIFFQADDRIFEYAANSIHTHLSNSKWLFMGRAGKSIYASDKATGLMQLINNQWTPIKDGKKIAGMLIANMFPMSKDSIFIVTRTNGFFLLQNGLITPLKSGMQSHFYINYAAKINDAEFIIATDAAGCNVVNLKKNVWQSFSDDQGLQNNNVLSVFMDANKNLWAGLNSGISYINYNSAIRYLQIGKTNNLPGYSTRVFNNKLYAATSNGLYSAPLRFNNNNEISITKDDFSLVKNTGNREAWNLNEVNGRLLLGNDNGSYEIKGNEAQLLSGGTGSWYFLPTSSVYPAKDIIVGTYNGLKWLRYDDNGFKDQGNMEGSRDSYRFMALDPNGDIWASHPYRGIYRLTLSQDRKKYTSRLFTANDGLPSTLNNFVFKIKNQIVFATAKGLYGFNPQTNKFFPSRFLSTVFGKMKVLYLTEDKEGNIWFCNEKGTGVVHFSSTESIDTPAITYLPELTGQLLPKFESIYAYNKENVFIGSEKGLIHLNYQKYLSVKPNITVRLGAVKVTGKTDSTIFGGYNDNRGEDMKAGIEKKTQHLPASYDAFHFEYSSPEYEFQRNIEYSYQLEGYDNGWSAWTNKTEKDYTNLSNGEYTFKVKARDNQYKESAVVSYTFIINAPWYKTPWAIFCYISVFAGLVFMIHKYQTNRFLSQQQRLKYIHHLELEKNEKEIIKLQNEKLAQEVLLKKTELANTSMHLMEKADTITKIKEKVIRLNSQTNINSDIKSITELIKDTERINTNWESFAVHFDDLTDDFLNKLKKQYPQLTKSELKVCTYIKLNLTTKEIAQLLNITVRGAEVSRYRIRKKLGLQMDQSLSSYLNQI